ncbi:unnamed protein product, partial [Amoebophrya sp. A120]
EGARFHWYAAEFTLTLANSPGRAQELIIAALSAYILVFALLMNSVASNAFVPETESKEEHFPTRAFNFLLAFVFALSTASTLFLTYILSAITLDSEFGAWRQLLRFERNAELYVWLMAVANTAVLGLAAVGNALTAERAR